MRALGKHAVDQRAFGIASLQQCGYRFGRVLEIVVHGDDPAPARMFDPTDCRRMLAEIAAQAQAGDLRERVRQGPDRRPGFSTPTIVDKNQLP